MEPNRIRRSLVVLAEALMLAAAGVALGQPATTPATRPGTPPAAKAPEFVRLADEPFRLDAIGLSMQIPEQATTQTAHLGTTASVQIVPRAGSWVINIQTPRTGSADATPQMAADSVAKQIAGTSTIEHPKTGEKLSMVEFIDRQPSLVIAGCPTPGARFYAGIRREGAPRLMKGVTVFQPTKDQFVVFELVVPETDFVTARKLYEISIATAKFADTSSLEAARREAVKAGVEWMKQLTPEQITAAMPAGEKWFRMYRPGASGTDADAEELGYFGVKFWRGRRGEVNGQGAGAAVGDNPEGFLCEIKARLFQRQAGAPKVTDSVATYFVSPDRTQETWTVKTAVRGSNANSGTWMETGARMGQSLTVEVRPPGKPARVLTPIVPPEGYLSQFETQLLSRLLARSQRGGDYGFYSYRSDTSTVSMRRDALATDPGARGMWIVSSRMRDEETPSREFFNELGELIRAERLGGEIDEPIDLPQLVKLLNAKGLPTGAVK
ncbi:MAG: hypothetical protein ACREJO_06130 [Phycisphaerales bacterium]